MMTTVSRYREKRLPVPKARDPFPLAARVPMKIFAQCLTKSRTITITTTTITIRILVTVMFSFKVETVG